MEGKIEYKKGLWTAEEDKILTDYISVYGKGKWNRVAKVTGLKRRGKSCRLRWINYLSPSVKRGDFTEEEDDLIIRLHNLLGNRWSLIAGRVPGRTDNQVKNHWNTNLSKRLGIPKVKSRVVTRSASRENFSTWSASSFTPAPDCNTGAATGWGITEDISQSTAGLNDEDSYENHLWFFKDDLDCKAPNLMEFLHMPLDFVWHGL